MGKWTSVIGGVVYTTAALTLVILHFIPGVNVALWTVELAACLGGAAVVGGVTLAVALSEDEVDRAIRYMNNLETNLTDMKESLIKVEQMNHRLSHDQVMSFKTIIDQMIMRTDRISTLCSEARR